MVFSHVMIRAWNFSFNSFIAFSSPLRTRTSSAANARASFDIFDGPAIFTASEPVLRSANCFLVFARFRAALTFAAITSGAHTPSGILRVMHAQSPDYLRASAILEAQHSRHRLLRERERR